MDIDADDDEPESAEEIARIAEMERAWEAEAEQEFGPPAVRRAKNRRYISELCSCYTESVVRGLLVALSQLNQPRSARDLAKFDLMTIELSDVIQPFDRFGLHFTVTDVQEDEFTVEVSRGLGTVGDGGRFVFERCEEGFRLVRNLEQWIS